MSPLDESNIIGQPNFTVPRDIIATVLDIAVTGWLRVQASGEVNGTSPEVEIAGRLGRAMIAEKSHRPGLRHQLRIEEEVGTRSPWGGPLCQDSEKGFLKVVRPPFLSITRLVA